MKTKRICILMTICAVFLSCICCFPAAAEELPMYDYSSLSGKWDWDLSVPLEENGDVYNYYNYNEAWIRIDYLRDREFSLEYYHQKGGVHLYNYDTCTGIIEGNTITAYTNARKGDSAPFAQFKLILSISDEMIWLEAYNLTENGLAFSGAFYNKDQSIRKIRYEDIYTVTLNGQSLEFDQSPIMLGDRILVPLRKIFEALNADVYYDTDLNGNPYITAVKGDTRLTLWNSGTNWRYMLENPQNTTGFLYFEDTAPIIADGRTLVPVRIISEALNAQVDWDEATQTVHITAASGDGRKNDSAAIDQFTYEKAAAVLESQGIYTAYALFPFPLFDDKGKSFILVSVRQDEQGQGYKDWYQVYHTGEIAVAHEPYENTYPGASGLGLPPNPTVPPLPLGELYLGMDSEVVKLYLGDPEFKGLDTFSNATAETYQMWQYPSQGLELQMKKDGDRYSISNIYAESPCPFTVPPGISLGSTRAEVLSAYEGKLDLEMMEASSTAPVIVGSIYWGTIFGFENDRVSSIFIGAGAE